MFNNEEETVDVEFEKYLTFLTDKRTFAFPITDVIEIIEVTEPTPVPEFPEYVKGIINTKGRVIPVIDIRLRFGIKEIEYTDRTCIIVVSISGVEIGFIVDTVVAVIELNEEMIAPPPVVTTDRVTRYIIGVAKYEKELIVILNAKKILDDKGFNIVAEHTK
jgi:purine-binding chemotaxis protein CheW